MGTPVVLTDAERDVPARESKKVWYAWQMKGLELKEAGQLQEAVYCFQQAMAAWPATLPPDEAKDENQRRLHKPVPTDTMLQLGFVYAELGESKWALHYLDEFDRQRPGTTLTKSAREQAQGK